MLCIGGIHAQVGINTTSPTTTLDIQGKSPSTKVEGMLIPRFTGDEIFSMPISTTTGNEGNLVYATSAASTANQTGVGVNLKAKGFYYWDGAKWVTFINETTNNNYYSANIKPMNVMLNDQDTYPFEGTALLVGTSDTAIRQFKCNYTATETSESNPLNFEFWSNTSNKLNVPAQLLGYTITINLSLKDPGNSSNAAVTRFVAYSGTPSIAANGLYSSGGTKIKDLFFKISKTGATNVRDELVLSPILVTQEIVDNGIYLFMGSAAVSYYEPILTVDYGVVDVTIPD